VFYVCRFIFKEEEEGGRAVSRNLGCELARSSWLVFLLHEGSNKCDSDWCLGFWKDEESHVYEGMWLCKRGHLLGFLNRR
jgi:hypothetical protein